MTDHEKINRAAWNEFAEDYQAENAAQIMPQAFTGELCWGTWHIPEARLRLASIPQDPKASSVVADVGQLRPGLGSIATSWTDRSPKPVANSSFRYQRSAPAGLGGASAEGALFGGRERFEPSSRALCRPPTPFLN